MALSVHWNAGDVAKASILPIGVSIAGMILLLLGNTDFEEADAIPATLGGFLIVVFQGLILVGLAAWFSVRKYRTGFQSLGFVRPRGRAPYLLGILAWLVGISGFFLWIRLVEIAGPDWLQPPQLADDAIGLAGYGLLWALLSAVIVAPISEEIFFRGFATAGLKRRYGTAGAIVISSVLFGIVHIYPGSIVPTAILGAALAWLYFRTGSVWPPIFVHGLHNAVAISVVAGGL